MEWIIHTVWQRLKAFVGFFFRSLEQHRPEKRKPQVIRCSDAGLAPNRYVKSEVDASGSIPFQPDHTLDGSPVVDTPSEVTEPFSSEGLAPSGKSVFNARMALERANAALEQAGKRPSDFENGEPTQTDEIAAPGLSHHGLVPCNRKSGQATLQSAPDAMPT